jgi:hypothetical protein
VDELEKAISVAERNPAYYGLNDAEIRRRRSWTSTARNQVLFTGYFSVLQACLNHIFTAIAYPRHLMRLHMT